MTTMGHCKFMKDSASGGVPAVPRLVCLAVGVILLSASGMGAYQYLTSPIMPSGLRGLPGFDPALIGGEIFLGIWLISGALPQAARRVAIGCFSLFARYALYEAIYGKTSCGCFGQVQVNPWFTVILDAAIVLALVFLAKPAAESAGAPTLWVSCRWPVAAALGIGLLAGIGSAVLHSKSVVAADGLASADNGKLFILEPHKWLGHRLPVLKDIVALGNERALGRQLAAGQWIVMFYHASCDECRQTIPFYEALAQREAMSPGAPGTHIAFIRVPSDPPTAAPPGLFHSRLALRGTLDASHQWFATTPIVVELRNGIVNRVATGAAAMRLTWLRAAGAGLNETVPIAIGTLMKRGA